MTAQTDKLKKLKQQREKIDRKIKLEQSRQAAKQRKEDTRRKIIAGALALTHKEQHPDSTLAKTLDKLIKQHVTKPADRALFGLEPLPENDNTTTKKEPADAKQ